MPEIDKTVGAARKLLPMFYVIDVSGSMDGEKIASVNDAMRDIKNVLEDIEKSNADAEIRLAAMSFSTNAQWLDVCKNGLVSPEDFWWSDVEAAGLTSLGSALELLDEGLSSKTGFLKGDVGFNMPVVIFMSDGGPTDNWLHGFDIISQNNWYKYASKIAIAIGDDADLDVLTKLVGTKEAIIRVKDTETLKQLIKIVSATASKIGSKSRGNRNTDSTGTSSEIVKTTVTDMTSDDTSSNNQPVDLETFEDENTSSGEPFIIDDFE